MRKRTSKKIYRCSKQTTKKYTTRPSPAYPANECPNVIKTGNDGKKYISLSSLETGVFKWVLYSKELMQKREEQLKKIDERSKIRDKELKEKLSKRRSKKRRSKKSSKKNSKK